MGAGVEASSRTNAFAEKRKEEVFRIVKFDVDARKATMPKGSREELDGDQEGWCSTCLDVGKQCLCALFVRNRSRRTVGHFFRASALVLYICDSSAWLSTRRVAV